MIHIKNLNYYYKKNKPILQNVSSNLETGKIYGLLGLNGEGKTTFLKLIAGILFPREGNIALEQLKSTSRTKEFHAQIYFLPDQPLSYSLNIDKYVSIYSSFYENFSLDFFYQSLQDLHIDRNNSINSMSLGQQKKLFLAFALAANTKYLLLDEPTNGLDIPSKAIVRKLLAKSIDENKIILISTHLVKDVENLLDHLLILKDCELVFDMSTIDISNKYKFQYTTESITEALYQETSLANYKTITENVLQEESLIDLEVLFNAVQQNKL
ncbi:ATP-binding cassette domain-containing protein [Sphingobacterium bovistauri]|uniref:ABC transporter ATP-binding protein n=1 Tax=Sphingobacterium bovistauri TaxID=2781959 RepID=A0ABS7Z2V4_9SPHI|nr:ABC transporter ATP-binding protein [Sphingobacterium bovistauri]MCA5004506.1 ABC transporter ATP-binding protein [Sphingobacterium bovistauri]